MPKTKKTSKRKSPKKTIRRKPNRPRLGLFLLAGLGTIFLMWVLIREPRPVPQDLEPVAQSTPNEAPTAKAKKGKTPRVAEVKSPESEPIPKPAPKVKIVREERPKPGEAQLDMVIRNTANSIGVPEQALRRKKSAGLVSFSIPVDRSKMDLTYANMILKGNLERFGATMLSGEDASNRQLLVFHHRDYAEKYQLELYYDSKYYKDKAPGKRITIVVDDFGAIGGKLLNGFHALDTELCFAIFPGEANSVSTMQRASSQGRETLIHTPMEPIGYPSINPGKNAILLQHNEAQIDKMLSSFISELPDAIGINNHMGSLATTDADVMQAVMNTLKKHDKAFLDSRTTNVSVAYQTAQKTHLKAYRNDLFLDSPNISQSTMDAKLNQIIQMAATKNHIIAITHCHNLEKLDYLKKFIIRLKKAGFTLVPLSEYGSHEVPEIL